METRVWGNDAAGEYATKLAIGKLYLDLAAAQPFHAGSSFDQMDQGAAQILAAAMILALKGVVEAMTVAGVAGGVAAREFGRLGGHMMLLQILETCSDETATELAAEAVELAQTQCTAFPMKRGICSGAADADPLACALDVCEGLRIFLRRRAADEPGSVQPAREISNMLWGAAVVLVRYLQRSCAARLRAPSAARAGGRCLVLEMGAGLGATGLAVAALARRERLPLDVVVTDADWRSVRTCAASARDNELDPHPAMAAGGRFGAPEDARACVTGVTCSAVVLDWEKAAEFKDQHALPGVDLLLGSEIVHEKGHAAGVLSAIKTLLAPHGEAVLLLGTGEHRFGATEFEEMACADPQLSIESRDLNRADGSVTDPEARALIAGMESLESGHLVLRAHHIKWSTRDDILQP